MSDGRHSRIQRTTERLYGLIQIVLPTTLRRQYGTDARELFRDMTSETLDTNGVFPMLRLVARIYLRTIVAGANERWRQRSRHPVHGQKQHSHREAHVHHFLQDIVYALREFRKRPGFSLTAVLTVALGVGATTTIFSIVDTVVLRQLPYPMQDRLVFFDEGSHTGPDFKDWQQRLESFDQIAAVWPSTTNLTNEGNPTQVGTARASTNLFPLLGARAAFGRLTVPSDETPGANAVALLSYDFWISRWGGDPTVIGRHLTLDENTFEIVGVLDKLEAPAPVVRGKPDIWLPLDLTHEDLFRRGFHVLGVVGRLRADATLDQANLEMDAWETWAAETHPEQYVSSNGRTRDVPLLRLHDATVQQARPTLFMLLGAVGLMLLIACANVANLFLARGTDRARETALRSALGATIPRIIAQSLTESVSLAATGGFIGVAASYVSIRAVTALAPNNIPRLAETTIDIRILLFATIVSIGTGVLFGIAPAFYAARTDVGEALKDGGQRSSAGRGKMRLKSGLVIAELALAIVLLVGAGLLFNSFVALSRVDPGFEPQQLIVMPLQLGPSYDEPEGQRSQFARDIIERLGSTPGVRSASVGVTVPFSMLVRCCFMSSARSATDVNGDSVRIVIHPIAPRYFETMGSALVRGRELTWDDPVTTPSVAVISTKMADRFFPGQDPIGQTVAVGRSQSAYQIVGVVNDMRHWSLSRDEDVDIYIPYDRLGADIPFLSVIVRTNIAASSVLPTLRTAVWALDAELPVPDITVMDTRISESIADTRFLSLLLITFSAIALILAITGVYSTMLFAVTQRNHEFGVRMALGADSPRLIRHVLRHGAVLAATGVGLGLTGAFVSTRVLEGMVFGVSTTHGPTFAIVSVVLAAVAVLACYLPAHRAARVDPMITLRGH